VATGEAVLTGEVLAATPLRAGAGALALVVLVVLEDAAVAVEAEAVTVKGAENTLGWVKSFWSCPM
jgi:hypothetical protein